MSHDSKEQGFTLVELAIVLIISGFIISTLLFSLQFYTNQKIRDNTIESIENSQTAAYIAQIINSAYPCPADRTLPPTDPNYGQPDCAAAIRLVGRDVDNADGDNNPLTGGEIVLLGALPFQFFIDPNNDGDTTDAIVDTYIAKQGFDEWGNKLSYAVTESLTLAATYNPNNGAIDVVDEILHLNPDPIAQRTEASLLDNWGSAHFVVFSHGPNGVGAYTENGTLVLNCNLGLTIAEQDQKNLDFPLGTPPDETENCEDTNGDDATFMSGLPSETRSLYYDDTLKFMVNAEVVLWEHSGAIFQDNGTPADFTDDFFIYQIQNTNSGNTGFGMKDPMQKADINGDIQAHQIHANELCSTSGVDCMLPDAIAGDLANMKCPTGQVVTKISNNAVTCSSPFSPASFGGCPPGEVIAGLSTKTGPICTLRP